MWVALLFVLVIVPIIFLGTDSPSNELVAPVVGAFAHGMWAIVSAVFVAI